MTISTSTPKSSGWPRISITRPTGAVAVLGEFEQLDVDDHAVQILDASPPRRGFTPMRSTVGAARAESPCLREFRSTAGCARRAAPRSCRGGRMRNSPTTVGCARFSTLTISPSARPPASMRAMRTITRSPCMAFCGGIGRDEDVAGDACDRAVGNQKAVAVAMHAAGGRRRIRGCAR